MWGAIGLGRRGHNKTKGEIDMKNSVVSYHLAVDIYVEREEDSESLDVQLFTDRDSHYRVLTRRMQYMPDPSLGGIHLSLDDCILKEEVFHDIDEALAYVADVLCLK